MNLHLFMICPKCFITYKNLITESDHPRCSKCGSRLSYLYCDCRGELGEDFSDLYTIGEEYGEDSKCSQ